MTHRVVLVGPIPLTTFTALLGLFPDGAVVQGRHDEGPNRIVIEWPATEEDT